MECRIEGCGRAVFVKEVQLCQRHYTRLRRHGDPLAWVKPTRGVCSLDGCERPHCAVGLCTTHYRRSRKSSVVRSRQPCATCGGAIGEGRSPLTVYCSPSCRAASKNARVENRPVRGRAEVCEVCGELLPDGSHRRMVLCSAECRKEQRRRVARRAWLWNLYGLTSEDYDRILARQGGGCAGCGRKDRLCVDHDKATGVVRGVLCSSCNIGIGWLGHNVDRMERLVSYLREPPALG